MMQLMKDFIIKNYKDIGISLDDAKFMGEDIKTKAAADISLGVI